MNTTKYLDFLSFAEAFTLYTKDNSRKARKGANSLITEIIGGMNRNRKNFNMNLPNHYIKVTPYWLLGFVEGDGSFYLHTISNILYFSVKQKGNQTLLEAIKHFLLSADSSQSFSSPKYQPTLNPSSAVEVDDSEYIKINLDKSGVNEIRISNVYFLDNVLIPFFDGLVWQSKKYLDYCDWKALFKIIKLGHHYTPEGLALIKGIASQMNNNRLSTSKAPKVGDRSKLLDEIEVFFKNNPSNYEIRDGRTFIKSSNRFLKNPKRVSVSIKNVLSGDILYSFESFSSCGKFLGLSGWKVNSHVQRGIEFEFEGKLISIIKTENKD